MAHVPTPTFGDMTRSPLCVRSAISSQGCKSSSSSRTIVPTGTRQDEILAVCAAVHALSSAVGVPFCA